MSRIAIIGSRDYPDYQQVRDRIFDIRRHNIIVTGGARGVDTVAETHARLLGFQTEIFPADWNRHGKQAGIIRNVEMLQSVDVVIAFWDGVSPGTKHGIETALKLPNIRRVEIWKAVQS